MSTLCLGYLEMTTHIVEHHTLTLIEAMSERPLLPFDDLAGLSRCRDFKAGSLGLHYVQRLDVGPQLLILGRVFIAFGEVDWASLLDLGPRTGRHSIDTNDPVGDGVHDGRNGKRESVVVAIAVIWVLGVAHVQEALAHAVVIVIAIRSYYQR